MLVNEDGHEMDEHGGNCVQRKRTEDTVCTDLVVEFFEKDPGLEVLVVLDILPEK